MNRQAQGIVMLVLGGAVLRAGFSDLYLRYVRNGFQTYLILAGIVLVLAAIATFWFEFRAAREARTVAGPPAEHGPGNQPEHGPGQQPEHGPGHGHPEPKIAWLLVLPLFALVVVVPPALGSYAADRNGTVLPRPFGYPTLESDSPLEMGVLDYATRAVYDDGRSLAGRQIELSGFVTMSRHGTPYLTRMVLNCCAADAAPVKVALSGPVPTTLRPDSWVQVIGTYPGKQVKDEVNGGAIPLIQVGTLKVITAPADEYEG